MGRRALAVVVFALVVLAGCAAVTDAPTDGWGDPTATVDADNPWRESTLTVAVRTAPGDGRDYVPLVREALDYWEENAEQYAGYPVAFDLRPDADDPDLVVSFVAVVENCDDVGEVAGCAPYVTAPEQVDRPGTIEVVTGLTDESTVHVLRHEVGHALGLGHDDEPRSVMTASEVLTSLPRTDAVDREFAWHDPELSVYVDYSGVARADREEVRRQVDHALDYYERGAAGHVPDNVTFVPAANRSSADVVVSFPARSDCGSGSGSCGARFGYDPDDDGAVEWFTGAEIEVIDVDPEAVGWHVGYWLGYGLGFTDDRDWPAVFRDATAEERRSDWWDDADRSRRSPTTVNVVARQARV